MSYQDELLAKLDEHDAVLEQRNALVGQEGEEVRGQVQELDSKLDGLRSEVRKAQERAEEAKAVEEARSALPTFTPRAKTEERSEKAELRSALRVGGATRNWATSNEEFRAVLGTATKTYSNGSFGDHVMQSFVDRATLTKAGAIAQADTTGGPIAALTVDPVVALTARGSALPDTTTGADVTLGAYTYGGIVRVDNNQINDDASSLESNIARKSAGFLANKLNVDLVAGDGTAKPTGLLTGAGAGVSAAAAALTAANLYKLRAQVDTATAWVMNSATFSAIWALDVNGFWTVNPQDGLNRLLGVNVVIDENMEDIGASNRSVVLGDFADGYYLRVVGSVETQTLVERYAEYNQTGVKVVLRADGVVTDDELVRAIDHAAS